jgi:rod shape-determining protein MreB
MDEGIAHYLRAVHQLAVGSQTAEKIKLAIGSVIPNGAEPDMEVRGRHLVTGLPTSIKVSAAEVRSAVMPAVREIIQGIRDTLEQTPPELSSDIARDGILLAGGGTMLEGFADLVGAETGMPVHAAESPLTCVAYGSGQALAHLDTLARSSRQRSYAPAGDWRTA